MKWLKRSQDGPDLSIEVDFVPNKHRSLSGRRKFYSVPMLPRWSVGFFAISQRVLALTFRRISPKDRCNMDAALRRKKGRLCLIIGKDKSFVSKWSRFFEENVSNFPFISTHCKKNLWTFLRNLPIFLHSPSLFWGKGSVSSSATPCTVLSPIATRFRGHAPAHHALSELEIFAFTLHLHS